jgi:hypothetical protein
MLFRARPLSRGPSVCFRSLRSHANRSAGLFRARPLALVVGAAALLSVLAPSQALAAPKDAQATKAHKAAMEEDYLESRFDDAEKKVRGALDACGESGCSKDVKAKLYMALGIVLINGKSKKDDGKQAFIDGLKLDPKAEPDPDYVTSDIKSAFDDAKKAAGSSGPSKPSSDGPISVLPVPEQKANTPVPVYVSLDEDTAKKVTSVTLSYVPTSGGDETSLELEKSGKGWRGNVPCTAVEKKGTLKYWIVAKDKKGKEVGAVGSSGSPLTTSIKADLDGKAPSWPGFAPPEPCAGGEKDKPEGPASSHRQCVDDKDCPEGEACSVNECLLKPKEGGGGEEKKPEEESNVRRHWISLTFVPDFAMISGSDVCGYADAYDGGAPDQANEPTFVCVRNPDGENKSQYLGQPTPGQGNNVNFGFGVATMRLMLGYEGVIIKGLSAGLRLGWAFNGTNEEFASFIPFHAEGRLRYTFGAEPFSGQVVRPWLFIAGGLAQVDVPVEVDVLEDGEACGAADPGDPASPCTASMSDGTVAEERIQTLRAIKQGGLGFAGGGAGVSFVPVDLFEINVGLRFSVTFPYVVPILSPEIGVGVGF